MAKSRYVRKPIPEKRQIPFTTTEEAWFWFMRSERARREGARLTDAYSTDTRPCEPDDLYRFVLALRNGRKLRDEHLRVLAQFGWRECPPDPRVREEERALLLWDEALDRLSTILKSKGIVRHENAETPKYS